MKNFDESKPIYLQLKKIVEEAILSGTIQEGEVMQSNRNIAKEYQLNPQTVSKAMKELIEADFLYKKRGIGLFVQEGARVRLVQKRLKFFREKKIEPFLREAKQIGISESELQKMITKIYGEEK